MPAVQSKGSVQTRLLAISAVKLAIVRIQQSSSSVEGRCADRDIANAVGSGIVRIEADSVADPLLCRQDQAMVAGRSVGFDLIDIAEILTLLRVSQISQPALIDIRRRVAARRHAGRASERTRDNHRWVQLFADPEMRGFGSHVCGRDQPVASDLPLQTQVPRINCRTPGVRLLRSKGTESYERRIRVQNGWERVSAWKVCPWVCKTQRARWLYGISIRRCGCGHGH